MNGICKRLSICIRVERRRQVEDNVDRVVIPLERIEVEKVIFPNAYVSGVNSKYYESGFVATYKLGPAPVEKVASVRGIGVNPEKVRPYPGISVQEMPCTGVFRDA